MKKHRYIKLDPDNTHHLRINRNFNNLLYELLKGYIDCSYHSFNNKKYHISKYYIIKSLSLIVLFSERIKKNQKRFCDNLKIKLEYINSLNRDKYNIDTIDKYELYKIQIH